MVEIDWGALIAAVVGLIAAFGAMMRYVQKRAVAGDKALLDLAETQGQVALLQEQMRNRAVVVAQMNERIVSLGQELAEEKGRGLDFKQDLDAAKKRIHELELDKAMVQSANDVLERFVTMFAKNLGQVIESALAPGDVAELIADSDGAG